MSCVVCGQQWYVHEYSPIKFLKYVPWLITWPTYLG
jgi:bacteriorhodopsin